jgi:hypothetical protein
MKPTSNPTNMKTEDVIMCFLVKVYINTILLAVVIPE